MCVKSSTRPPSLLFFRSNCVGTGCAPSLKDSHLMDDQVPRDVVSTDTGGCVWVTVAREWMDINLGSASWATTVNLYVRHLFGPRPLFLLCGRPKAAGDFDSRWVTNLQTNYSPFSSRQHNLHLLPANWSSSDRSLCPEDTLLLFPQMKRRRRRTLISIGILTETSPVGGGVTAPGPEELYWSSIWDYV